MDQTLRPVFVFDRDGYVHLFKSHELAAGWVEALDVAGGEYDAFIGLDGTRLNAVVVDVRSGEVQLQSNGEAADLDHLRDRLDAFARTRGYEGEPEEPRDVANQVFRQEWERAWPSWWPWLHRRLHGAHPPVV